MKRVALISTSLAGCGLLAGTAQADVRLPAIISDNMVLQANANPRIWGWADPGERVKVDFGGRQFTTAADLKGNWRVRLRNTFGWKKDRADSPSLSTPVEMTIKGKNTLTVRNILLGNVWLCSGQSSMKTSAATPKKATEAVNAASYPNLRFFLPEKKIATVPTADLKGRWVACTPETVGQFSATGYFFGRELMKTGRNSAMGLIDVSWDGVSAESWTSRASLEADPDLKYLAKNGDKMLADYLSAKINFQKSLQEWQQSAEEARNEGKPEPKKPEEPGNPSVNPQLPSGLYNGVIAPIVPFTIKGVVWYEGDDVARTYQYRKLFATMIHGWRQAWRKNFSFLYMQAENFTSPQLETLKERMGEEAESEEDEHQIKSRRGLHR